MRSKTSALGAKNLKQDIKSGFIIFITIISLSAITVFAANWYDSLTATSGESLTATKWNSLTKATVPTGAIMAFNLTACPDTWTEYLPARGRFLRGIDPLGTNDTVRALGNYQADDFKSHTHTQFYGISTYAGYSGIPASGNNQGGPSSMGISSTGGTETRPKNVAVLYCVKL